MENERKCTSERLTYDENGEWGLKGVKREHLQPLGIITNELYLKLYYALRKLRAYENTELSPKQVEDLKKECSLRGKERIE